MANLLQSATGAARTADALLQINGSVVFLRMPLPATPNDDAEQLGLASPQFQNLPLAPVVWRRSADDTQLLLSATAIRTLAATLNAASTEALFATAAGVVAEGVLYEIVAWKTSDVRGEPFCYRLTLRPHHR